MAKLYERILSGEIGDSSRPSVLEVELEIGDSGPPPVEHVLSAVKAVVTNNRGDDVTQGLIGYWALDDSVGLVARDSSGYGNDGVFEGSAPTWVDGISGQAVNFPGTNERVDCGTAAPLDDLGNGDFSISFWMKSKDTVPLTYGMLFSKRLNAGTRIELYSNDTDSQFYFTMKSGGTGLDGVFGVVADPFNTTWNHIVIAVNRTTDKVLCYTNGVKDSIELDASSAPADCSNAANLSWGAINDGGLPYEGILDECRIYNRVLTEGEIEFLHAVPSGITNVNAYPVRAIGGDVLVETDGFGLKFPDGSRQTIAGDSRVSSIVLDQTGDPKMPDGAELFEFNTPDVVSSLGRTPIGNPIYNYFPAKITEQGIDSYDNPWRKWDNRGAIGVFKAAPNPVPSPEDLTNTAGWTSVRATVTLSDLYFNGKRFSKIQGDGTGDYGRTFRSIILTGDGVKVCHWIFRKGTAIKSRGFLYDTVAEATRCEMTFVWATKVITEVTGSLIKANWYGDDIVEIWALSTSCTAANAHNIFVYGPNDAGGNTTTYGYVTAVMVENSPYPTPYTPTSRAAGQIDYPLTMPSQFTIMFWLRPWFTYDTSLYHRLIQWYVSGTQGFWGFYNPAEDQIWFAWEDEGTERYLASQAFTAETIAAWIHIAVKIDLTTGDTTGSSLWINGTKDTDAWNDAIDAKTSSFNVLSVGHEQGTVPADSLITDLLFAPSLLADSVIAAHYIADRPFYVDNRLLGKNCEFRLDEYGNAYFKNMVVQ